MKSLARMHRTFLVIIHALFPTVTTGSLREQKNPLFHPDQECIAGPDGTTGFFIDNVLPLAAPFILFRLKRSGFSGCRVTVQEGGLLVKAIR